jgi:prephenate dehydrogenase
MSVRITIVGLGQIGSSIGLALKAHNLDIHRIGHDKDPQAAKESQKAGAVDDVKYNLPASIRESKIVILALPLAAVRETLEIIAPDLQEGALVLDTAPAKATVAAWAKELLPPGRFYIGLTPAINPEYLHGMEFGVKAARADLFQKGLMVVNAPTGTPGNMFNLAMDLVKLLGAMPLLMDTAGRMASSLPCIFFRNWLPPPCSIRRWIGPAGWKRVNWQGARMQRSLPAQGITMMSSRWERARLRTARIWCAC